MMTAELFDTLPFVSGSSGDCMPRARGEIGKYAETLAARAIGAALLPIGNQVICPDFELGHSKGEIKSVGASGQCLAYVWRLEKEAEHFWPHEYLYVFVKHTVPISISDRAAVLQAFAAHPPTIVACTLADVIEAINDKPLRLFPCHSNPKHGSVRGGYARGGYQFRLTKIAVDEEHHSSIDWPCLTGFINLRIQTTPCFRHATSH